MIVIQCDDCKTQAKRCIPVDVENTSPHNGDYESSIEDICIDCLEKYSKSKRLKIVLPEHV